MNRLGQFWHYINKVFALSRHLHGLRDDRPLAQIPAPVITLSLLLGAVLRVPSLLQLEAETARRGWQRLTGWAARISDDCFGYALERCRLDELRMLLVHVNRTLKKNKQFDPARISGLLVVAIDGNEQFKSRHRCCADCSQRHFEEKDASGQLRTVTEYYHRQVYAHIDGPGFSTVLDIEPIGPHEEEAGAALRMLGRMRRLYGPRFFDAITLDAWYVQGPFIRAVQKLGWGVVAVLKQERFEIFQEAVSLCERQQPTSCQWQDRQVQLWDIEELRFTEVIGPVRVVVAKEKWPQRHRTAGQTTTTNEQSNWMWLATVELAGYGPKVIHQIGHQRWGIENHTFNELTRFYHLEHCHHHHGVAIMARLLILVLGFTLFEVFARLHCKLWRTARVTLQEISRQIDRGLEAVEGLQALWSG